MKKNTMMRLASVMLVLVLLTTCAISGTFAKYVTEATSTDTARVAKFGVQLNMNGDMFADVYATDDEAYATIVNSVDSNNGDDVVAPGTTDATPDTVSITGTPEVAVKVDVAIAEGWEDVVLKAGTYTDWTKVTGYDEETGEAQYGTFTLAEDYYPIVWTLTQKSSATGEVAATVTGNLATIVEYLENYSETAAYKPNTALDAEFTLTWQWHFSGVFSEGEGEGEDYMQTGTTDAPDTWLGNAAAGVFADDEDVADNYNLNIAYEMTVTVTQID